jgi:methyl-accepting chemotaxis protein
MKLSIRNKILLLAADGLVLLVILTGIVNWQFNRVSDNKNTIALTSAALRDHMQADMMHDALRADVLAALHAASNKDAKAASEVAKDLSEHAESFRSCIKANHARALDVTITAALASVDKPLEEYIRSAESIVALAANSASAAELQWPAFSAAFSQLEEAMGKVGDTVEASVSKVSTASNALVKQFRITIISSLIVAVLSLSLLSWSITRSIVNALNHIRITLREGTRQIGASTSEISNSSKVLAEAASEQAASLEETSASLEEISSMTKRNAENSVNSKTLSQQASQSANSGLERLGELSHTLTSIKSAVGEMQAAVGEMQGSSQEIAKIIKTIDEIAFQTNLLALNAAVEAARAGEAGAGFAVVADEVRSLAQRSAQAARDTSDKIESAIKRSELGGIASARVVQSLFEVEATAQNIQQVFNGIVTQIKSLDAVIGEISAASREQSQGVGEVNMAVGQMDKVTQSNASSAEENASAAEELRSQVGILEKIVHGLEVVMDGTATLSNSTDPSVITPAQKARLTESSAPAPASLVKAFHPRTKAQAGAKTSAGSFENF